MQLKPGTVVTVYIGAAVYDLDGYTARARGSAGRHDYNHFVVLSGDIVPYCADNYTILISITDGRLYKAYNLYLRPVFVPTSDTQTASQDSDSLT